MTAWYDRKAQPRFKRPPVVEAAIGVEFGALPGLGSYQLARLQDEWIEGYPLVQDVPGVPASQLAQESASVQFQFGPGSGPVRLWASNPMNGMLVQTQADRLVLNWRDEGVGREYPRYEYLREEFGRLWQLLIAFLGRQGMPSPQPVFGEYTYVNIVELEPGDTMADVVTVVQNPQRSLPGQELLTRFQFVRDVEKGGEHPMAAQIVVTGEPQALEGRRRVALNVDTRTIFDGTQADVLEGVDRAHALSSFTFDRIITDPKRAKWGELQESES